MEKLKYKMTFGSNKSFEIIERIAQGEPYDLIFNIVQKDASVFVRKYIPSNDREDIIQEIHLAVYKNIKRFFDNCSDNNYDERSRNAWLKKIAISKCMTYLRNNNGKELSCEELETFAQSDINGLDKEIIQKEIIELIIEKICLQKITVDKRLAFLLIVIRQAMCSLDNGKPSDVVDLLDGKTINEAYKMVISYLEDFLERDIYRILPVSFIEEVMLLKNETIQLETKQLTDASYSIRKKIRNYQL